jgi:hypothetical protein
MIRQYIDVSTSVSLPSISITASTSTPNYGATVSFSASASNFTPTSYIWYSNNNVIGYGNPIVWTANVAYGQTISCLAYDSTRYTYGVLGVTATPVRLTSLSMDGVNDWAGGNWAASVTFSQSETWSFWIKLDVIDTSFRTIMTQGYPTTAANFNWMLSTNAGAYNMRFGEATGVYAYNFSYVNLSWQHLLISRRNTGSAVRFDMWSNGTQVITNGSGAISIGSNVINTINFGNMATAVGSSRQRCKVTAFSHYLGMATQSDATQLYNSGTPLSNPITNTGNLTLVEYFPFIENAVTPSTNYGSPTVITGINGGKIYMGNQFASPYGLVTDIP